MMLGKKKVTGECFPCKIVFEKVMLKSGFSRKFPYPPVEEDGIPGGGRKKTMVNYRGVVKVLTEFQGRKEKKTMEKSRGVVNVLMEFQGKKI